MKWDSKRPIDPCYDEAKGTDENTKGGQRPLMWHNHDKESTIVW